VRSARNQFLKENELFSDPQFTGISLDLARALRQNFKNRSNRAVSQIFDQPTQQNENSIAHFFS
jgi:hypothetical protein